MLKLFLLKRVEEEKELAPGLPGDTKLQPSN